MGLMTPEDLDQIRQIVREEISGRMDRAMTAVADEFTQLRSELDRRFAEVDRRFEGLDRRMERINEGMRAVEVRMAALSKWADNIDRDNVNTAATQAAQQRAIDQLAARVARIEKQLHPES